VALEQATSSLSQSGLTSVSLFRQATYSPCASRMPMFMAAPKPLFSSRRINLTSGNFDSIRSSEPSLEALSTTIVRKPVWV